MQNPNIVEKMNIFMSKILSKSPKNAAQTAMMLLFQDPEKLVNGGYYSNCRNKP